MEDKIKQLELRIELLELKIKVIEQNNIYPVYPIYPQYPINPCLIVTYMTNEIIDK